MSTDDVGVIYMGDTSDEGGEVGGGWFQVQDGMGEWPHSRLPLAYALQTRRNPVRARCVSALGGLITLNLFHVPWFGQYTHTHTHTLSSLPRKRDSMHSRLRHRAPPRVKWRNTLPAPTKHHSDLRSCARPG